MTKKKIKIKLDRINIEDALYIFRFLSSDNKQTIRQHFRNTLHFPYSSDDELRKKQFEASPVLIKLIDLRNKFNQRDGWTVEKHSPLSHSQHPINNQSTKIIVVNDEIKIIDEKDYKGRFFLEFANFGKYEGNAQFFAEMYKEDILKASPLLIPFSTENKECNLLDYNFKRIIPKKTID